MKNRHIIIIIVVAIIIIASIVVVGAFKARKSTPSSEVDSVGGLPVQQNTFHIKEKKDEVADLAQTLGIQASKPKYVEEFDASGDGVPEGVYSTDIAGEYVIFMQGDNDTVKEARLYDNIGDPKEGGKVLILKKDTNKKQGYFVDTENHSLVQYDNGSGCNVTVYRWEQVQRGFVAVSTADLKPEQKTAYCERV